MNNATETLRIAHELTEVLACADTVPITDTTEMTRIADEVLDLAIRVKHSVLCGCEHGGNWSNEVQRARVELAKPNVIDINTARRSRDEQEERRLEQKVIERWTGPTDEGDGK